MNLLIQFKKTLYELIVINENNLKLKKNEQIKKKNKNFINNYSTLSQKNIF